MIRFPLSLKHLITLVVSSIVAGLIALVIVTIGRTSVEQVKADVGDAVRLLADQMQERLDHDLFERSQTLSLLARLYAAGAQTSTAEARQTWIAAISRQHPEYHWIGFVGADGRVVKASDGRAEGTDVSNEPWFFRGRREIAIVLLPDGPAQAADAGFPGIAIAVPMLTADGTLVGVLAAKLDWSWVEDVKAALFGDTPDHRSDQVLLLDERGRVLRGPDTLRGQTLDLPSVRAALGRASNAIVEQWPDGETYVTGFARSNGHKDFSGVGWLVLVRQSAQSALAPAQALQKKVLLWSLALSWLAILISWWLAGRIATPMLLLANAADAFGKGTAVTTPYLRSYREVEVLSRSLGHMVHELNSRQAQLREINQSLEQQVAQRTAELAEQNRDLIKARENAEEATAAKSRFLAIASHDLRQPLHAMGLFTRALGRRAVGPEEAQLTQQLDHSLASLREMFDALLDVSRLDAGLVRPHLSRFPIGPMLARLVDGFRAEAEARGLKFRTWIGDGVVESDPVLLEVMVRNLLTNALKFCRRGGILMMVTRHGGHVALDVFDTGSGIAAKRQRSIFNEFERSKSSATGHNDGLGLGLSIVRRYADLLAIDVRMQSRPGHGSRFTCMIPALSTAEATLDRAGEERRIEVSSLSGRKLLVVEDDQRIMQGLVQELSDRGATAVSIATASDIAAIRSQLDDIDAAIVDFDLGMGESGLGVVDQIEDEVGRPIPTLIVTGCTDTAGLNAVAATGLPWLTKPASPDEIARALVSLIATSAQQHASTTAEVHA